MGKTAYFYGESPISREERVRLFAVLHTESNELCYVLDEASVPSDHRELLEDYVGRRFSDIAVTVLDLSELNAEEQSILLSPIKLSKIRDKTDGTTQREFIKSGCNPSEKSRFAKIYEKLNRVLRASTPLCAFSPSLTGASASAVSLASKSAALTESRSGCSSFIACAWKRRDYYASD